MTEGVTLSAGDRPGERDDGATTRACDCCGCVEWQHVYLTVYRCERCDLHASHAQQRNDLGAPAGLQAVSDRLRASEYEAYVDLAGRYGKARGFWLDIGCGSGGLLGHVQARGFKPEGIEVTSDRRSTSAASAPGAVIYTEHLEVLGLPDEKYDVISLVNVFSHLPSPAQTFAEIRGVLAPGGLLILRTGQISRYTVGSRYGLKRTLGDENQWLGTRTLQCYAERSGFAVDETDFTPYLAWVLSPHRLQMPSASPRVRIAKAVLRNLPGRDALIRALQPLFPIGTVRAVLQKL